MSVQWLWERVALAFSGDFVSAVGFGGGLHSRFGAFLRVQWCLERVALAIWGVFASAMALGAGCTGVFGRFC